ncbi:MAG TPA: carbamoyltransferase HypF [Opitutaceae bacterium]|nr:carbamoyltransferase HypF [Opitutaceae bacterium]
MCPEASIDRVFVVTGTVQGVGFRPFVARLAARLGVCGWVRNDGHGVTIRARAPASVLEDFAVRLRSEVPPAARIAAVTSIPVAEIDRAAEAPGPGFVIVPSASSETPPTAAVTPDLALCDDCRRELFDATDRRHGYPFINCTNCGPRYSILHELPYDRRHTTMAGFRMCPVCQREYEDPADRRYHAQPNACPACGPQVELLDGAGRSLASRDAALAMAAEALCAGRIVAVKGLGGFHLMVDAANEAAVGELRRRKHREEKPLAVMFPSVDALRAAALVDDEQCRLLSSPAAPIVLVRRRPGVDPTGDPPAASRRSRREERDQSGPDELPRLAESVAPANPWVGALLPYTPLHVLLLEKVGRALVATSGNLSEEPLCTDNAEAQRRLAGIADLFLMHDRPIARPVDDSVVRRAAGTQVVLRRARGFAPSPFALPSDIGPAEPLLCVGGHLKNTVAVTAGNNVVLSPHIGDLSNPVSMDAFRRTVALLGSLYGGRVSRVVCDAHPDYASTRYAQTLGLPVTTVQHHLAHVLACLLEHGGGPERVLGVAWDGTGYGSDGTVWGGEFIVVDRKTRTAQRVASLLPFRLPGGEAAVREPRRSALGLLHEVCGRDQTRLAPLARSLGFGESEIAILLSMLDRDIQVPMTTSAGRLFDGVASLLGMRQRCSFEGQAAMEVEFAADTGSQEEAGLIMPIIELGERKFWQIDWRPAVAEIRATTGKVPAGLLAARFHAGLARGIVEVAMRVGIQTVVLSGGCFQNARLLDQTSKTLRAAELDVLCHRDLPPNDGGLAAGQALGALWDITSVSP